MNVEFKPEVQEKLDRAASANNRPVQEYVQDLVATYVDYDAWFRGKVTASIDSLDRGESLSHEEVVESLADLLNP